MRASITAVLRQFALRWWLIVLGGLLIGAGLWYWLNRRPFDVWNLLPHKPLLLIETKDFDKAYRHWQSLPLAKRLASTPYFAEANELVAWVSQTWRESSPNSPDLLDERSLSVSFHVVPPAEVGALVFLKLDARADSRKIEDLVQVLRRNPAFKVGQQQYRGLTIYQIAHPQLANQFSFLLYRQYLVGSITPVLVEDVARHIDEGSRLLQFDQQGQADRLLRTADPSQEWTVYWLPDAWQTLLGKISLQAPRFWANFAAAGLVLFGKAQPSFSLSAEGYSFAAPRDSAAFINIFQAQNPQVFSLRQLLPQHFTSVWHASFSNAAAFGQSWITYQSKIEPNYTARRLQLEQRAQLSAAQFFAALENEIALVHLNTERDGNSDKLLLLRLKDPKTIQGWWKTPAKAPTAVGNYAIHSLPLQGVIPALLGDWGLGFEQVYYTFVKSTLVIANHQEALQEYLLQYTKGNLWLNTAGTEAAAALQIPQNFRCLIQPQRIWDKWMQMLQESWQITLNDYAPALQRAGVWVYALTWKQQQATNLWQWLGNTMPPAELAEIDDAPTATQTTQDFSAQLGQPAFTIAYPVLNHTDKSQEILVQDYAHRLYLLSSSGRVLWQRNMGAALRSAPTQIDVYANGRLQYLFITQNRLHLVDRLGRNVPGFPRNLGDTTAQLRNLSVVAWTSEKQDHYTLSDSRGRVYVLDPRWQYVRGWFPRTLPARLGAPLRTIRVREELYVIAALENGIVQVYNQRGEIVEGFPLKLSGKISQEILTEAGSTPERSYFTCLTDNGYLGKFNLKGKIVKEEQIYRPSPQARVQLCPDQTGRGLVVALTDEGRVAIFNANNQKLFEKSYNTNSVRWAVSCYTLSNERRLIAVVNQTDNIAYLYDQKGEEVASPFGASQMIRFGDVQAGEAIVLYFADRKRVGRIRSAVRR